jgi:hypothetical protein
MTFDHRKSDSLDYERNLPIVMLTMDIKWDPHNHHDDHGKVVIEKLEANLIAGHSDISLQEHVATDRANLSAWNHGETCSVFALHGEAEDIFQDALQGTRKAFYGKAFHLDIPWRRHQNSPHIHFLRQYDVDEFLGTLSYHELLGFLPDDPTSDSYIFAIREANVFRSLCEDPTAFYTDGQLWYDPQSDTIRGDTGTDGTTSCTDWELNMAVNHTATATANWASMKHQYTEEDLERMRPWLAWIPI